MQAPDQILTAAQMRAAEEDLIAQGTSVEELMERAGQGAADWIWRIAAGRKVTVLCGPGNNGGDGYVIARVLEERGLKVEVVAPLESKTEAAIAARKAWGGVPVAMAEGGVLVDCLFGTGLTRALPFAFRELLNSLAMAHNTSIAIDLPSGVDSDTGSHFGAFRTYDCTLALGAWKPSHWLMPALQAMGERKLVDIGIAHQEDAARLGSPYWIDPPLVDDHKYTRGLATIIGGEMPGAAILAAKAALHGGAGYVKILADDRPRSLPDAVVFESLHESALLTKRNGALLVGPGLGRMARSREVLALAFRFKKGLVLDGDALMIVTAQQLVDRSAPTVLTPHAGELAQLCSLFDISESSKIEQVGALADASSCVVVAKGPDTVIAEGDGETVFMPPASSWLSTAGSGDVLAGLIASAYTNAPYGVVAAIRGCQLHAEAARLAGPAFSASTLIDHIPAAYERFL